MGGDQCATYLRLHSFNLSAMTPSPAWRSCSTGSLGYFFVRDGPGAQLRYGSNHPTGYNANGTFKYGLILVARDGL